MSDISSIDFVRKMPPPNKTVVSDSVLPWGSRQPSQEIQTPTIALDSERRRQIMSDIAKDVVKARRGAVAEGEAPGLLTEKRWFYRLDDTLDKLVQAGDLNKQDREMVNAAEAAASFELTPATRKILKDLYGDKLPDVVHPLPNFEREMTPDEMDISVRDFIGKAAGRSPQALRPISSETPTQELGAR